MWLYFAKGFLLALFALGVTAYVFKQEVTKGRLEPDNKKDKETIVNFLIASAALILVGWPITFPLWVMIIIVSKLYEYIVKK